MSDSKNSATTETTADPSRRLRIVLWITGSLLWGVVTVWLVLLQRDSQENRTSNRSELASSSFQNKAVPPQIFHSSSDEPLAQNRDSSSSEVGKSTQPIWDPQGIEDFSLTERSGREVTKSDLLGRPWAICFVFTHCQMTCPRITSQFKRLQQRLGDADVRLVSLSVDPKRDSPEQLRQYAETYDADPQRWWFLTGDQQVIYRLIQRSFKLPVHEMQGVSRKPGFEVLHSNVALHVDAQGRVVKKYDAMQDTDMVRLQRALLAEAAKLQETRSSTDNKKD